MLLKSNESVEEGNGNVGMCNKKKWKKEKEAREREAHRDFVVLDRAKRKDNYLLELARAGVKPSEIKEWLEHFEP